ncbi:mRNA-decapping enzyme subunit 2 [Podila humilis]|nr:mRNA-decapping enzyme subunit 2 [Podila humilis]
MAWSNASFENVLDDLSSRFIINVPDEELASVERICFQIEQAHWFYEDFVREQNSSLPSFSLKNFSAKFFQHCPLLHEWANEHETAFANFMEYKFRVPVCGAIILNESMDKCILVKGWAARSGWGFPKGKINKDEQDVLCAAREVWEETGFDITPFIQEDDFVEQTMKDQRVRLYIIKGVPETTVFEPQTRKEISKIEWHRLTDLPTMRPKHADRGPHSGRESGSERPNSNSKNPSRYYMVIPFVQKLKHWITTQRKLAKRKGSGQATGQQNQRQQHYTQQPEENIETLHHNRRPSVTPIEAKLDSDVLKSMLGIGINKSETHQGSGSTPTLQHTQASTSQSLGANDTQQSSQMLMSLLGIQHGSQIPSPSSQAAALQQQQQQQQQQRQPHQQQQQQQQQHQQQQQLMQAHTQSQPHNGSDAIKALLGITPGSGTNTSSLGNGSPQMMSGNRNSNGMMHPHYSPHMVHQQQHYTPQMVHQQLYSGTSPAMAHMQPHYQRQQQQHQQQQQQQQPQQQQPQHQGMGSPSFANSRKSSVDLLSLLNSGHGGAGGVGGVANGGSPLMYRQEAWNSPQQNRSGPFGGISIYQQQQQHQEQHPHMFDQGENPTKPNGALSPPHLAPAAPKVASMQEFKFDLNSLV